MTRPGQLVADAPPPRLVGLLEAAALAGIVGVLAARPFISEMTFRWAQFVLVAASPAEALSPPEELARVSLAMVLLASAGAWAAAQALRGRVALAAPALAPVVAAFALVSFPAALQAVDARAGLNGWIEQVALLLACFVTIQLARRPHRRALVIVVLAALAATMAWKAVVQVVWEVPSRCAFFKEDPVAALAAQGIAPGSPKARLFEKRLSDPSATGYLALSNVFGSMLIVLASAAAGLAAGKLTRALRGGEALAMLRRGQVHLPMLAAVISALVATASVVALVLTRGKGAIAAGAAAGAAAAAVLARPAWFARHRRKLLLAAAGALLAGAAATWAYGSARGGLPGRSLQVRWEYWVGAKGILAESPLWGAGPGNFGDPYLKHRPLGAEEATKTAHNVLADAACSFGLPAATLYLGILAWVAVTTTRPAPREPDEGDPPAPAGPMVRWCIFLTLVVLAARLAWIEAGNPWVALSEGLFPAAVFAAALAAATWAGHGLAGTRLVGRGGRILLAAGLAGFLLHNLVTYTLFTPATATVFWVAAAVAVAPALPAKPLRAGRPLLAAAAAGMAVALLVAGIWLWRPVARRTSLVRSAQLAFSARRPDRAIADLRAAVAADELDGLVPKYLAQIALAALRQDPPEPVRQAAGADAVAFAALAYRRSPRSAHAVLLAEALALRRHEHRALDMIATAVRLDPMNARLRWRYAGMLFRAGRLDAAAEQLRQARRIDGALLAGSDLRFSGAERAALAQLEQAIEAARQHRPAETGPSPTRPAGITTSSPSQLIQRVAIGSAGLRVATARAPLRVAAKRLAATRRGAGREQAKPTASDVMHDEASP